MLDFTIKSVSLSAQAGTKREAIEQVGRLLVENGIIDPRYIPSMLSREEQADTYLGFGVSIPHGLAADRDLIRQTGIAVVQFPHGVPWQEGQQSRLVIGIAARGDEHLDLLSRLTGLLQQQGLIERLATTGDARDIVEALTGMPPEQTGFDPSLVLENACRVLARIAPAHGLHARPSTAIAALARRFDAKIRLGFRERLADARNMASILALGAPHDAEVEILAEGPEAAASLDALRALLESPEVEEPRRISVRHDWKPEPDSPYLAGVATSPGLAIARVHLMVDRREAVVGRERAQGNPTEEATRLAEAIETSREQLKELHHLVSMRTNALTAQIFLAQLELLDDDAARDVALAAIAEGSSASKAWSEGMARLATTLTGSGSELVAARTTDVRDVESRVLGNLEGTVQVPSFGDAGEPAILVARDLTPSQAATLDPDLVAGFCTVEGGATSHVAILARSLGIVAVTGTDEAILALVDGRMAILDGDAGRLYHDPRPAEIASAREASDRLRGNLESAWKDRFEPAITLDGHRMEVAANITDLEGASKALDAGGEGVGLVRSEFLFLGRDEAPGEEEQFLAYRGMVRALAGLPLVLRTLDIGGDKAAPYIRVPHEDNPFLGVRGIRLCLRQPELFRPQLRAAYRASVEGPLRLMFPMVTSIGEFREAKRIAEEIREELQVPSVPIGVMIEVPAAVLLADVLAREADFFSIGTNDLTQYVMAMDRGNSQLARQAQGTHPAVLRMISLTVEAAHRHGRRVGVCGGLAGELVGAALLAGLGVDELSMALPDIARVKSHLRGSRMEALRDLARRALACEDDQAVQALVDAMDLHA